MFPSSSMSMFSDDGISGSPGISIISPEIGIINPAPEDISTSLTLKVKSLVFLLGLDRRRLIFVSSPYRLEGWQDQVHLSS